MRKSKNKASIISIIITAVVIMVQLLQYPKIVLTIKEMNIQISDSLIFPLVFFGVVFMTTVGIVVNYNILKVIFQLTNRNISDDQLYSKFIISMLISQPFQRISTSLQINRLLMAFANSFFICLILMFVFKYKNKDDECIKPIIIYGMVQMVFSIVMNVSSGFNV